MRKVTFLVSAILIFSGLLWAFWIEPSYFRIANYTLTIPQLSGVLHGYRIAIIADLHIGSPYNDLSKLRTVIKKTNDEKPDLVLIVGDLVIHGVVGGKFVEPKVIAKELKNLRARDGVFGVLGNHDWWYNADEVRSSMESNGIRMLDEAALLIGEGANSFWLMGIGDFWEGSPNVEKTLENINDQRPVIALTHNPDIFPEIPERVALTLAGHTHGGQVYIPLIGRPIVPSKYGQKYAFGYHQESNHHLFVSPGVGTSILPVRFLVPPEVSIIEINPKN